MENKNNANVWIWVGVVLVLIIVVWLIVSGNSSTNVSPASSTTSENTSQTMPSVEDTTTGDIHAGSPAASIAYTDALVKYANARLQLDENCQANIPDFTFKNNSYLMVDNRAPVARTVHIGSVFSIKAYGFKIIQLSSATLPATWLVDCDAHQNVATILIQK